MAPRAPASGTSIRNHKAGRTVFNRGAEAAREGKSLADCPYTDTPESNGRKWRALWMSGFRSVKIKKTPEVPPP